MDQTTAATTTVPEANPATADLICWLWAAFPTRDDKLHIARIADALGVSSSTLRRWITDADGRAFDEETRRHLAQRAILRGRGTYLWPELDQVSRRRQLLQAQYAARVNAGIRQGGGASKWENDGTLDEHVVAVVHFPKAHVYGVTSARTSKSLQRVQRYGDIVHELTVPNRYAAVMLKHATLTRVERYRCIVPRELVPTGRTETWRTEGGALRLRRTSQMRPKKDT